MHPAYASRSPETVTSKVATASLPFYWSDSKYALCNRSTLYGHAKNTVNLRQTVLDRTRLLSSLPQLARCRLKALGWAQAPVGCSSFGANLTPVPTLFTPQISSSVVSSAKNDEHHSSLRKSAGWYTSQNDTRVIAQLYTQVPKDLAVTPWCNHVPGTRRSCVTRCQDFYILGNSPGVG